MEVFIALLLIVILVTLISAKGSINERIEKLENEMYKLRSSIDNISAGSSKEATKSITATPPPQKPERDYWKSSFEIETKPIETEKPPLEKSTIETEFEEEEWDQENDLAAITATEEILTPQPPVASTPPKPGFFERNPDLEKFIGENLVSKIGIAILVLAIGFFVKYAIDNEWIGTIGRVAIGLLCGGILVGIAHKLQKNYHAFSSVLVGGGLAVFYFTISLAYHEYRLFGSTTTFIIMLVITAFAVALALLYDRQEVAVIALVGGFVSPFLASSGSGNYQALFMYLIILNAGLLVIAYNKAWRLLNLLAFIFTAILFWSWLGTLPDVTTASTYRNALLFATIFYLLFFAINIANNIKENRRFIAADFGILLSNTALYFSVGLYCLASTNATEYNGLFSASMGVFNLAASWFLFRNQKTDPNILYLLIGVTLTFVSLTAPLQLHGNHITLFWASEAVLLYWLYQKSQIKMLQLSTVIIFIAMLVSLVMDWFNVYFNNDTSLPIIVNRGFITTIYSAVATCILFLLMDKKTASNTTAGSFLFNKNYFAIVATVLLYLAGLLEIVFQFTHGYPGTSIHLAYVQIYTFSFALLLLLLPQKLSGKYAVTLQAFLLAACIILYLILAAESYSLQEMALIKQTLTTQFTITQILIALLAGCIFYRMARLLQEYYKTNPSSSSFFTWVLCVAVIVYLSVEVNLLVNQLFYSPPTTLADIARVYNKTGLAILWGVSSFAFMWLGMRNKYRPLRIFSLTLFSLTLIKLFAFDIRNIAVAGKIAAFFCLGVLLLVISFMYQRLKKIIVEDEKPAT